jgi:tetratricopeptide (TPR) repeat protein
MFQHALALHRQGMFEDAARGYQSVLAAEPAHLDALVHLGVLRLGQGLPREAEALLRRAATVAPDSAEAHGNLAAAVQAIGRHEDAVTHYQHALALKSGMVDAQFGLAACLQALGRHDAAIACYEAILAAEPAHPEANFGLATLFANLDRADEAIARYRAALAADGDFAEANFGLGTMLMQRREFEEATICFRQALDVDPDYLEARLALGLAFQRLERDDESMAAYRAALELNPDRAAAHHGLATILCRKRREAEAIPHFEIALEREPGYIPAMAGLAGALTTSGRQAEAIALCRRALAIKPDFEQAISALGVALAELGDIEGAVAECRRAVALAPERPDFCYVLTQLAKVRRGDPVVGALDAMLPRAASLSPREQCWLHFGLAKAYDDLGEQDRGFACLLEGNAIKRRQDQYQEARDLGAMNRIRKVFTAELITARGDVGDKSTLPVFIVGMPRSGTTLVEQVLASHNSVFGAGERLELPRAVGQLERRLGALPFPEAVWTIPGEELRQIGADYVAALQPLAPDARRIIDKMPVNFHFAGLIHLILPNARIIHVIRDPVDTCLSCFSKLFSGEQPFAYDLGELGRFHRAYQQLMAHWRQVLPPHVLLEVHYESLVEDLATEARRMVAHCGLDWDDACLEFHKTSRAVHTASVTQVRQPIYRGSVGRWRPEPTLLQPLLDGLGRTATVLPNSGLKQLPPK